MSLESDLKTKVKKYKSLTETALKKVSVLAEKGSKEHDIALDYLDMAKNYFNDACYYEQKGDFLTALASFSYSHAWLDAGVRAKILKGSDDKLFTLP